MRGSKQALFLTLALAGAALMAAAGVVVAETKAEGAGAQIGQPAPQFSLQDQDGKPVSLDQYKDKIVVLEWVNPECPYVQRHYQAKTMITLRDKYKDQNVEWIAINSTHSAAASDNKKWITSNSLNYPILDDSQGTVGHAYGAVTTPHMFIIDKTGSVVYKGAIDNDPKGKEKDRVNYVDKALSELVAGKSVSNSETKSYGCSVKYAK